MDRRNIINMRGATTRDFHGTNSHVRGNFNLLTLVFTVIKIFSPTGITELPQNLGEQGLVRWLAHRWRYFAFLRLSRNRSTINTIHLRKDLFELYKNSN